MRKNLIVMAVTSGLLAGCAAGSGSSRTAVKGPIASNSAYLSDSAGNVVLSGGGECTTNGSFTKGNEIIDCDPEAAAKAEAEKAAAEKAAAEKAAAERAAAERAAAEQAAAEKAAAAAAAAATPEVLNLSGKTLFASGSGSLSGEGKRAVQAIADELGTYASITSLTIIGHSDSSGDDTLNQQLSEKRAMAVREYIEEAGLGGGAQISVMGMGESQPIASNDTAEGRRQNRRVEIEVRGTK